MQFVPTDVAGAWIIEFDRKVDARGYFARAWCVDEVSARGIDPRIVQVNASHTSKKGALRGMHFQTAPRQEAKTVSCTRGKIFDVVLDLRKDSPTFLRWAGVELSAENRRQLHLPAGCAHGFQTLEDDCDVLYLMSEFYSPEHARGFRHDDPAFGIHWPLEPECLSDADRRWPAFTDGKETR